MPRLRKLQNDLTVETLELSADELIARIKACTTAQSAAEHNEIALTVYRTELLARRLSGSLQEHVIHQLTSLRHSLNPSTLAGYLDAFIAELSQSRSTTVSA